MVILERQDQTNNEEWDEKKSGRYELIAKCVNEKHIELTSDNCIAEGIKISTHLSNIRLPSLINSSMSHSMSRYLYSLSLVL